MQGPTSPVTTVHRPSPIEHFVTQHFNRTVVLFVSWGGNVAKPHTGRLDKSVKKVNSSVKMSSDSHLVMIDRGMLAFFVYNIVFDVCIRFMTGGF